MIGFKIVLGGMNFMDFLIVIILLLIFFGILSIDARLRKMEEKEKLLIEKLDQLIEVNRK